MCKWLKNVKFASISDQLINTAIIMDTMFNTEVIVKDMKGGKEDMTETIVTEYGNANFKCWFIEIKTKSD